MTAFNVLLLQNSVHVFSDTSQYRSEDLARLPGGNIKVHWLPTLDALFTFSGNITTGYSILVAISEAGLKDFPALANWLPELMKEKAGERWSMVLAGVAHGQALGIALDYENEVRLIGPGKYVSSVPASVPFDPADIIGSGCAIVRDQAAKHAVVGGQIIHSELAAGRFHQTVIGGLD